MTRRPSEAPPPSAAPRLRRIALRDFVIVRELDLDLAAGFSVLTGETGAGKSILIDALQLALGARADAGCVRDGAPRADISAEFDSTDALRPWLYEAGFHAGDSLLLRRSVDSDGRSRAWVNGTPATATQLRELGERLVDIHGQHAWQSLTRPASVRALLDGYAGADASALRSPWQQWRGAQKALADARSAQGSLQQERERLAWQIGELERLAPGADEWDALNTEHTRLSHAQALLEAAQSAVTQLEDDTQGALTGIASALTKLQKQEHVAPELRDYIEVLTSMQALGEDLLHSLHGYLRKTEPDPARLATLDERLSLWLSLARRHRRAPDALAALLLQWREELTRLDAAADLDALERVARDAETAYQNAARQLGAQRRQAAPRLAGAVTQAMQGLGMAGGRFEVALTPADASEHGLENVEFLVAGHPGAAPRPVAKVASGGELSRIALAIAVVTSRLGTAPTLIFDEVDAGIGGAVAESVGRLMKQLGSDRQVLAVTHLPQVAACADQHLVVAKQADATGVASRVDAVAGEARVAEIARMLGGERLSGTTLAHAKEMLGS